MTVTRTGRIAALVAALAVVAAAPVAARDLTVVSLEETWDGGYGVISAQMQSGQPNELGCRPGRIGGADPRLCRRALRAS